MKNKIKICGDVTKIFLKRNNGEILDGIIDTKDLEKVHNEFPYSWYPTWDEDTKSFYVCGHYKKDSGHSSMSLHRFLLNAPSGFKVDHINHDTLDNRRSNLRLATDSQNMQNIIKAQKNNTIGVKNISKTPWGYVARLRIDGKPTYLGIYKDLEVAKMVVEEARAKLMPYSQEALEVGNCKAAKGRVK